MKTARAMSGWTTGGAYDGAERFAGQVADRSAGLVELFVADEVVVVSVAPDYGVRLKSDELLDRSMPPSG